MTSKLPGGRLSAKRQVNSGSILSASSRVGTTTENCVVVIVVPLSTLRDVNEEVKDGESMVSGNLIV